MKYFRKASIDWVLLSATFAVSFGLITMNAFVGTNLFLKTDISFAVAIGSFFLATRVDTDMLKR